MKRRRRDGACPPAGGFAWERGFYPEERPIHEVAVAIYGGPAPSNKDQFRRLSRPPATTVPSSTECGDFLVRQGLIGCRALESSWRKLTHTLDDWTLCGPGSGTMRHPTDP